MLRLQIDENVELRPFVENDADKILHIVRANLDHLHTFLHWATDEYSLESAQEFIKQSQDASEKKEGQALGIFLNRKLVGATGFVLYNWTSQRTEIGYWLAKNFEGQGIITKSCKELIKYAFDELQMNRIEIRCATENVRSAAIPKKLNFKLDGILRQSEWRHTKFYDMAVYSMLKKEWEKINNR